MKRAKYCWDGDSVRALRRHLCLTQTEMADELGVRQQTISEWETGVYRPRGPSATLLGMVAERAGFAYQVERPNGDSSAANRDAPQPTEMDEFVPSGSQQR